MQHLSEDHGGQRRLLRGFQHAGAARKQGGNDFQSNLFHPFRRDYSRGLGFGLGFRGSTLAADATVCVLRKTTLNPE
jgi:hypothetical protein